MLDIKLIRENPEFVKENIKKKFQNEKLPLVNQVKKLDEEWRKCKYEADNLRKQRNIISEEINESKKKKDEKKASLLIKKAKSIPEEIAKLEEKEKKLSEEIKEIMYKIPNIIHSSVPIGKDATENVEIKKIGKIPKPNFEIINHAELAEKLGGADFDTAREISGKGFYYLKGKIAQLSSALINFARDYMIEQGYEYIEPPLLIRKKVVEGVMSFAEMDNMMYKIEGEDLYLIGTSEHSVIGMYMDKVLQKGDIPQKITAFSPCFRKEIGAHGIDEKGVYRVHQFYKQEMVVICEPKDSYKFYDEMLSHTINVFKALEIPIRVLECCSGDLADLKAKSCDVEAWSPRQQKYFEVGSLTNMEEAQARRLNIKINGPDGNYFSHTLNNTVLANSRALVALMENHQQKDGSIKIPKVLWKYTRFKEIKPTKKQVTGLEKT
ncbi:MAG: serine--tRNA ligase [Nanoarchaeota archaeon]|nr:serine--tRNA ligase [Nanoarchaeota archaeon]